MKDLDPVVLLSVTQAMLGNWLWPLLAAAALLLVALAALIVRERRLTTRRLGRCLLLGLLGGPVALWWLGVWSASSWRDAAGPIDWLLGTGTFALGAIVTTMVLYTLAGWRQAARTLQ